MDVNRACYRVTEMTELLGVSPWVVYERVRTNELPHIRLGNRILFPKSRVDAWLMGATGGES